MPTSYSSQALSAFPGQYSRGEKLNLYAAVLSERRGSGGAETGGATAMLHRELDLANERVREAEYARAHTERDAALKLQVKDELLKRLHEELKVTSDTGKLVVEERTVAMQQVMLEKEERTRNIEHEVEHLRSELAQAEAIIATMHRETTAAAQTELQNQGAHLADAEARATVAETKVEQLVEVEQRAIQQSVAYERLIEQTEAMARESQARDRDAEARVEAALHEKSVLEDLLRSTQESLKQQVEGYMHELNEATRTNHELERVLFALKEEISSESETHAALLNAEEDSRALQSKIDDLISVGARQSVRLAELEADASRRVEVESALAHTQERLRESLDDLSRSEAQKAAIEAENVRLRADSAGLREHVAVEGSRAKTMEDAVRNATQRLVEDGNAQLRATEARFEDVRTKLENDMRQAEDESRRLLREAEAMHAAEKDALREQVRRAADEGRRTLREAEESFEVERANFRERESEAAEDKKRWLWRTEAACDEERTRLKEEVRQATEDGKRALLAAGTAWDAEREKLKSIIRGVEEARSEDRLRDADRDAASKAKLRDVELSSAAEKEALKIAARRQNEEHIRKLKEVEFALNTEVEKLKRNAGDNESRLAEVEACLDQARNQLEKSTQQLEAERAEHRRVLTERSAEHNRFVESSQARIADLETELRNTQQRVLQLTDEKERENSEFTRSREHERARLESQIRSLTDKCGEAQRSKDDALSSAAALEINVNDLKQQLTQAREELKQVRDAHARKEHLLEEERNSRKADATQANDRLTAANQKLTDTTSKLADLENIVQKATDGKKAADSDLAMTKDSLEDALKQLRKERDEHRGLLKAASEERNCEAAKGQELKQRIAGLQRAEDGLKQTIENIKLECDTEKQQKKRLEEQFDRDLQNKNVLIRAEQERASAVKTKMEEDLRKLQQALDSMQREYQNLQHEHSVVGRENSDRARQLASLESDLRAARQELDEARKLKNNLHSAEQQVKSLEAALLSGESEKQHLAQNAREALVELRAKVIALTSHVETLTDDNKTLKRYLQSNDDDIVRLVDGALSSTTSAVLFG